MTSKFKTLIALQLLLIGHANASHMDWSRSLASVSGEKNHVIFFIHGLQGDKTTFCDFPSTLHYDPDQNEQNDDFAEAAFAAGTRVYAHAVQYHTKSEIIHKGEKLKNDLGTLAFAKHVKRQITKYFRVNNLPNDTEYSFIVHSQGGLVAMRYSLKCVTEKKCDGDKEFLECRRLPEGEEKLECIKKRKTPVNLKNIISFGTPYWGSRASNLFSEGTLSRKFRTTVLGATGSDKQIDHLAVASLPMTNVRRELLHKTRPGDNSWVNPLEQNINFYNIGGHILQNEDLDMSAFHGLLLNFLVPDFVESDIIVDIPSTRVDFHYYKEFSQDSSKSVSGTTNLTKKFYPISYWHVPLESAPSFIDRPKDYRGMACVRNEPGTKYTPDNHAGYQLIKNIFYPQFDVAEKVEHIPALGEYDTSDDKSLYSKMVGELKLFQVQLEIKFPYGIQRLPDQDQIKILMEEVDEFGNPSGLPMIKHLKIDNELISKFHGFNSRKDVTKLDQENNLGSLAYYHYGQFASEYAFLAMEHKTPKSTFIRYTVLIPGYKNKVFTLKVSPTYSSYAQLEMNTKYMPLKAKDPKRYIEGSEEFFIAAFSYKADMFFRNKYARIFYFNFNTLELNQVTAKFPHKKSPWSQLQHAKFRNLNQQCYTDMI
ncbi:MAG: hypothetical protein ISR65_10350 [Bacteriovoracaceae bacterium]|nr:hypothetical protein [Bacteriovoracaceae bacterium]